MSLGSAPQERRGSPALVWYASYGSNMHLDRLRCYLAGGCPRGGAITLPGARDPRDPARSVGVELPGVLYFATESLTWTGGRAFYCPDAPGRTAARAHLLTVEQFSDIVAQEMYRPPGADLDLSAVLATGRAALGPGRYETLVHAGDLDGHPILTCTAPWRHTDLPGNPPSAAYLRHLAAGLAESHRWPRARIAEYLATRPGAAPAWTPEAVAAALTDAPEHGR
ncbi:MAG TPA: histone deacetylase [Nocardia sp.]|uniref:histone deacetylase n=1 Tax=Nocardia sp. TaxID=1821 RepID=UPI002B4B56B8|nr:histone deacetylase [Nocardia sp.]HLS75262.1 histone deacetylase [Nocardia sp.]